MGRKMQELPGVPEVKFGKAEPYFDRLENRVNDNLDLRFYEYGNRRDKVQLSLPDTAKILETKLMEKEMKDKELSLS